MLKIFPVILKAEYIPSSAEAQHLQGLSIEHSESTGAKEGVNRSFLLTLEDDTRVIFKPQVGEHVSVWRLIPPKTLWKREIAAYEIDTILGYNLVPPTTVLKYRDYIGSVQKWVEDAQPSLPVYEYPEEEVWKMGLLDLIIGNVDRNSKNWLTVNGRPIAIDHGFAFPCYAEKDYPKSLVVSRFAYWILNKPIPENLLTDLRKIEEQQIRDKLEPLLDEESIQLTWKRIVQLQNSGVAYLSQYRIVKKVKYSNGKLIIKSALKGGMGIWKGDFDRYYYEYLVKDDMRPYTFDEAQEMVQNGISIATTRSPIDYEWRRMK